MRRIAVLFALVVAACSSSTSPGDPTGSIDGTWTSATSFYSAIHVDLAERADDHVLSGHWTGTRTHCATACVDSGIVFDGQRAGASIVFGLTATNSTRALAVTASFDGRAIAGTSTLTDDGNHAPAEPIAFHRP